MSTNLELLAACNSIAVVGSNDRRRYVDMVDLYVIADCVHLLGHTFLFEPTGELTPFFFEELAILHGWYCNNLFDVDAEAHVFRTYELAAAMVHASDGLLVFPRETRHPHEVDGPLLYMIEYAVSLGLPVVMIPRFTQHQAEAHEDPNEQAQHEQG